MRLMLRRVLATTTLAVALSAAGALAFSPDFGRASRVLGRGIMRSAFGFTRVPSATDSLRGPDGQLLQNGAGTPGTYCPTPPRDPNATAASRDSASRDSASRAEIAPPGGSTAVPGKTDLLAPPPSMCVTPVPATPASRSILP